MSITIANLREVYKTTFEARNKWQNILLELDVSPATIESISVRCRENPDNCYREGLSEWLRSGERCWEDLVTALSSTIVGHRDIAMAIEKMLQSIADAAPDDPNHQTINENLVIFSNENLGSGAFGVVFKGSYKSRPCAVKVLHQAAMQIQLAPLAAQDRDCEFLKSFYHTNVVQHLSTDKHPISGNTILVTELMDCNLKSYLSGLGEESHTDHLQASLARDVASGLAYIHSKQIIHHDLCGDNVLLTLTHPIPVAKVSDFGMSRLLDPSQMSSTLTAVGQRMAYLPPEALMLEECSYSLDVFSLGVIIAQIVRKVEFVKTTRERTRLVSAIPTTHRMKHVISACLEGDVTKRPTAGDVRERLEEIVVLVQAHLPVSISPK